MKIVLIGAPGSGKGTLAAGLERRFGLKHLSFGQIVRGVAKTNPRVKALIDGGNMIDDALAKEILTGRINQPDCQNGFILDGFPRSLAQAKMLKEIMDIDFAIIPSNAVNRPNGAATNAVIIADFFATLSFLAARIG